MRSDQDVLASVEHAFITCCGEGPISTSIIERPNEHSSFYAIERVFSLGRVVMYVVEGEDGGLLQHTATWRIGEL